MRLWFEWAGQRKDLAGKIHLWGILRKEDNTPFIKRYIFWCAIGVERTDVKLKPWPTDLSNIFAKKAKKENQGYKEIKQETIEDKWPQVIDDIEMQFMMEKLSV